MKIAEFARDYRSDDAIYWYTKPCFLHQLINKALHWDSVMASYTFCYFVIDLSVRIQEMAMDTKQCHNSPFRVYRGSIICREEVEQLSVGTLVATRGFFSTSKNSDVAKQFLAIDPDTNMPPHHSIEDKQQFVLFKIDVDYIRSPKIIVADVSSQSAVPEEHEMIFDIGTTFIIKKVAYDSSLKIWFIYLESSSEVDRLNFRYRLDTRTRLADTPAMVLFGRYLSDVSSKNREALEYFQRLLRSVTVHNENRPQIYFSLARIYRVMGKYEHAIHYYRCAQLLYRRTLPQSSLGYGCSLSGLGTVYSLLGDSARALSFCTQAMIIHQHCLANNHLEIAMNCNRVATAYWLCGNYAHALLLLSRSVNLYKQNLPTDHPCKAQSFHIMGLVHSSLGKCGQALACYKTALNMRESMLGKDHHLVAFTCYRLGLFYANQANTKSEALQYARRALRIMQARLPKNHPDVKMSMKLVENLSQQH
ncbi:unnamed protein product [Adineta steineri]|uniref:Uncharacterized protein n=1 Tax=Adineta steineri TaxID=433720 RepID=A0A815KZ66_9BILA|nr:unnamed protein product [Adineta steineri]CAF4028023.1 unnamed protein product [Adineta steineri]